MIRKNSSIYTDTDKKSKENFLNKNNLSNYNII